MAYSWSGRHSGGIDYFVVARARSLRKPTNTATPCCTTLSFSSHPALNMCIMQAYYTSLSKAYLVLARLETKNDVRPMKEGSPLIGNRQTEHLSDKRREEHDVQVSIPS